MAQERRTQAQAPPRARKRQRRLPQRLKLLLILLSQRLAISQQKQESITHPGTAPQRLPLEVSFVVTRTQLHSQPHTGSQARHWQKPCEIVLRLEISIPLSGAAQTQLLFQPLTEPVSFAAT